MGSRSVVRPELLWQGQGPPPAGDRAPGEEPREAELLNHREAEQEAHRRPRPDGGGEGVPAHTHRGDGAAPTPPPTLRGNPTNNQPVKVVSFFNLIPHH